MSVLREVRIIAAATLALALGAASEAGQPPPGTGGLGRPGGPPMMGLPMLMEVEPGQFDQPVKDAPFSADGVTTMTQVLADGNRIERTLESKLARDTAGRVRTEQSIALLGPMTLPGEPPRVVTISDPVARVHYFLDAERQTATRRPLPMREGQPGARRDRPGGPPPGPAPGPPPPGSGRRGPSGAGFGPALEPPEAVIESLGTREIEGVTAEGTRHTVTIPAGAMGNVRPMALVTERWVSPDLKIPVLIERRDPRLGDTVYRLININRSEPSEELFRVPTGFTITDDRPRRPQ